MRWASAASDESTERRDDLAVYGLFDFERGEPLKKGSRPYASMGVA
jgi:hypothetical protein